MATRQPSKPVQLRLPAWAAEYVDKRAAEGSTTRSGVMIQALECLRQRDREQLMEQGYREMAGPNGEPAKDRPAAKAESGSWPEW